MYPCIEYNGPCDGWNFGLKTPNPNKDRQDEWVVRTFMDPRTVASKLSFAEFLIEYGTALMPTNKKLEHLENQV